MTQSKTQPKGRVLIIAGSDSGGGAGLQADIKTITMLGGYAMNAVTAVTVQNTLGVSGVHEIPPEIVRAQIEAVISDLGADAWKLGMLGSAAHVRAVRAAYEAVGAGVPLVLDPVMIAKGGAALLAEDAVAVIRDELVPLAAIVTPNAPEAEALTGVSVRDLDGQMEAAEVLVEQLGAYSALVKGGHIEGAVVRDVLLTREGYRVFESERIETRATHGTGCTLASAIAAYMAQGVAIEPAVEAARAYLIEAIRHAPGLGAGHGPLGHNWAFPRGHTLV
ncbi:MAG TPA: bifunctional hydroxymethylpyrimidine kinase/phosphomethylpyrimidine kinase [Hyphomonadaceae bacterium]|nr:bifunctional hydroxymethylpyrimidine kinase/phosphomethylpyrimidine kinase [Hyphomonadaceae bacterium]